MSGYPRTLPTMSADLVEQMHERVPPAVVEGPELSEQQTRDLIFQAGRRSVVDELVRLLERAKEQ